MVGDVLIRSYAVCYGSLWVRRRSSADWQFGLENAAAQRGCDVLKDGPLHNRCPQATLRSCAVGDDVTWFHVVLLWGSKNVPLFVALLVVIEAICYQRGSRQLKTCTQDKLSDGTARKANIKASILRGASGEKGSQISESHRNETNTQRGRKSFQQHGEGSWLTERKLHKSVEEEKKNTWQSRKWTRPIQLCVRCGEAVGRWLLVWCVNLALLLASKKASHLFEKLEK